MKRSPEDLRAAASGLGVDLPLDRVDLLLRFEDLLRERAVPLGLVAEGDLGRLRERHVLDCLRAAAVVGPGDREGYDLGSGAGLPGIVVAIARPAFHVKLVEVRPKRAAFLELAVERLGLPNASVVVGRVEDLVGPVDLCFARAYSSAEASWRQAEPLLGPGGRLVYFAGEGSEVVLPGARVTLVASGLAGCGPLAIISPL